jgi:hypothetical protein
MRKRQATIVTGITHEEWTRCWGAVRERYGSHPSEFLAFHGVAKARGAWWFLVRVTEQGASTLGRRFLAVACEVVAVRSTQRAAKGLIRTERRGNGTPMGTAYCHYCGGSKLDGEHADDCKRPRGWKPPRRLPRSHQTWGWFQAAAVRKAKGVVSMADIRLKRQYGACI